MTSTSIAPAERPAIGHSLSNSRSTPRLGALTRVLPFCGILAYFLVQAGGFWRYTVDDAYISARYAANLAAGLGPVFNAGEPVMGYTNLLLVLIEALLCKLGIDPVYTGKVVGLAAGVMVLALVVALGQRMSRDGSRAPGLLAALLMAFYPFLALTSVMGLETSLFAALALGALLVYLDWWTGRAWTRGRQALLAGLLLLLTLTRPEGLAISAVFAGLQAARLVKERGVRGSRPVARQLPYLWLPLYLLLLLPAGLALFAIYGSPIPNTFFAKTASGISLHKIVSGGQYVLSWFYETYFYLIAPLIAWPWLTRQAPRGGAVVAALAACLTGYLLYAGSDWMPGYRFLAAAIPLIFVLAAVGMVQAWRSLSGSLSHFTPVGRASVACLVLVSLLRPGVVSVVQAQQVTGEAAAGYHNAHRVIGEWFRDETPPSTRIAVMDIGIIGYVSGRHIIDITGLVNRDVAMLMHADGGRVSSSWDTAKRIAGAVLSEKPDYIVLAHNSLAVDPAGFATGWSHDAAIFASPAFQSGYEHLFTRQHMSAYYLSVYRAR